MAEAKIYIYFFASDLRAHKLTVNSSSSELKILSRSLYDTVKSPSWKRLVETVGLLPDGP